MYAQRFGSLPIGRQTGGLSEIIVDGEAGFLFSEASTESLWGGIARALATFRTKERLNKMRERAMSQAGSGRPKAIMNFIEARLLRDGRTWLVRIVWRARLSSVYRHSESRR